ncbi:ISP domain-containing protein [Cucurbitaria berberidis CBS 394.84]|uniref:ISP domain-containing protein n=1 Tax=Cucurbitaria berberidis CBS 394.84 TaxID=1168544 RepID=A0A9P4LCT9_9PLEO|nr:ISP domain-containing protein [Cucurbitaria berberidis CBS 394.84]KAF1849712.1 ISP domain-containing protein [Cucurbitaria berberidis CBS 394.84]
MSSIPPVEVCKEPDLIDGWWTLDNLFALERRAIFSKSWICIAHSSRFTKAGDYISFEFAGFPILIILGKDNIVRAFHNVCRHRAYTITKKPTGSSLILGCRYHGWSYNTKGHLVKAPQFDGIEGFDKSENGLFRIHSCNDRSGFIHINLNASRIDDAPAYEGTGVFSSQHGIYASNKWLTGWEINGGAFNWKTIGASERNGTQMAPARSHVIGFVMSAFSHTGIDFHKCQTLHVGPTAIIVSSRGYPIWVMITVLPASATHCTMKCDVYTSDASIPEVTSSDNDAIRNYCSRFVQSIEQQYDLIKSTNSPQQRPLLSLLKEHLRLERLAGRKLYPARKEDTQSQSFCKAEQLCNELNEKAKLARVDSADAILDW